MSATTSVHEVELPARLGPETIRSLLARLEAPTSASVVVLQGADCFCDGLDLAASGGLDSDVLRSAVLGFAQVLRTLQSLPQPLLAVVEGSARGGGVGLAAACDVVLAGVDATFSLPEAVFGLTPAIVGSLIEARVGAPTLRRLALTASSIEANEAHRVGLVDVLVGAQDVQRSRTKLARALSRTTAAAQPLRARFGPDPSEFDSGARETLQRLRDPDVQHRIAAFERGECPWEVVP